MATRRLARPWLVLLIVAVLAVVAGVLGLLAATATSPGPAGGIAVREYIGPIDARAAAERPDGSLVVVGASLTDRARGIAATSDDGGQNWDVMMLDTGPLTGIVTMGEATVAIADCSGDGGPCLVRGDLTGWHAIESDPVDALAATNDGDLLAVAHVPHVEPELRLLRHQGMGWEPVDHGCPPSTVPEAVSVSGEGWLVACGAWSEGAGWIDEGHWQIVDAAGAVLSEATGQPEGSDLASYDPWLMTTDAGGATGLIANGHAIESADGGRSWEPLPLADAELRSTSSMAPSATGWLSVIRTEGTGTAVVRSTSDGWTTLYTWPWVWP